MKQDEIDLLRIVLADRLSGRYTFIDEMAAEYGYNAKRAMYCVEKWVDKGWWEFGVSMRTGWFTELGLEMAKDAVQ